jgi:hypothetical protein
VRWSGRRGRASCGRGARRRRPRRGGGAAGGAAAAGRAGSSAPEKGTHRRRGSGCGAGTVVAVISFCFGGEGKALVSEFFKQQISVRPTLAATPSGAASAN